MFWNTRQVESDKAIFTSLPAQELLSLSANAFLGVMLATFGTLSVIQLFALIHFSYIVYNTHYTFTIPSFPRVLFNIKCSSLLVYAFKILIRIHRFLQLSLSHQVSVLLNSLTKNSNDFAETSFAFIQSWFYFSGLFYFFLPVYILLDKHHLLKKSNIKQLICFTHSTLFETLLQLFILNIH